MLHTIIVYLIIRGLKGISFDLPTRSDSYKLYKNYCYLNVFLGNFFQKSIVSYKLSAAYIIAKLSADSILENSDCLWQMSRGAWRENSFIMNTSNIGTD